MSMSARSDPLLETRQPDRLFYATGMLLDQQDFTDEQTYHRLQLARTLAYLHGSGTAAGLRIRWDPPVAAVPANVDPQNPSGREGEIVIEAGLAIDGWGRLIEIPRDACIRLKRWYDAQPLDQLTKSFHSAVFQGVVADVFIRYVACERGKTQAFARGPFDATNAVVASRVRDAYELKLFLRPESDVPAAPNENRVPLDRRVPVNPWPDLQALPEPQRRTALREAVFNAWDNATRLTVRPELRDGQDPAFVFLARLVIPAQAGAANQRPAWNGEQVAVLNEARSLVFTPNALARALGL